MVGRFHFNVIVFCSTFQRTCQTKKLHSNGDLENHFVRQSYLLDRLLSIIRFLRRIKRGSTNLTKKVRSSIFTGYNLSARETGRETSSKQTLRNYKIWTCQKFMFEDSTHKKLSCQNKETNSYSSAQMVQLSWQEQIKKSAHPSTSRVDTIKEKSSTMIFKEKRTDLIQ